MPLFDGGFAAVGRGGGAKDWVAPAGSGGGTIFFCCGSGGGICPPFPKPGIGGGKLGIPVSEGGFVGAWNGGG